MEFLYQLLGTSPHLILPVMLISRCRYSWMDTCMGSGNIYGISTSECIMNTDYHTKLCCQYKILYGEVTYQGKERKQPSIVGILSLSSVGSSLCAKRACRIQGYSNSYGYGLHAETSHPPRRHGFLVSFPDRECAHLCVHVQGLGTRLWYLGWSGGCILPKNFIHQRNSHAWFL